MPARPLRKIARKAAKKRRAQKQLLTIRRIKRIAKPFGGLKPKGGLGMGYRPMSAEQRVLHGERLRKLWGYGLFKEKRGTAKRRVWMGARPIQPEMLKQLKELADMADNYEIERGDWAMLSSIEERMREGSWTGSDQETLKMIHKKYLRLRE